MSPSIEVRAATADDAKSIYDLACGLATAVGDDRPEFEAVEEQLLELLERPSAYTLAADGGEGVVGVASFWVKPDLAHGDTVVEMPMLAVSEDARRQGVGTLLMKKVRKFASDHGASIIELIATPDNEAARKFYRSLGFVETDHISLEFRGDLEDPPKSDEE